MEIKNRQQWLTVGALALVVLFAGDQLLFTPLVNFWKGRANRITELRKEVTQGKALLDREQAIRGRWEQMRRNTLPSNTSAAEQTVFKAIDQWAQDSRIAITALTPQWKRDSDQFITLQCRVDASGNMNALSRFIYDIEKDPMALKIESLELGARDKDGQVLAVALQLSGLVLNPQTK